MTGEHGETRGDMESAAGGLVRPDVDERGAETIARVCYGLQVEARELGSNQDRNFLLTHADGERSVLRIDNPVFTDEEREAQHAAIDAYRAAGIRVPAVLPGLDGALTQRCAHGYAVRRSEFAAGETMVDAGYFAPVVLEEFGELAAASVEALAGLEHPGLHRAHMWTMDVAHAQTLQLAPSITDEALRERVITAAEAAQLALEAVAAKLPKQTIHGDLTDDNVMGQRGDDSRLHPRTVLDLGDLAYGWRVSELAVTASSMLHHEADRPLRVLHTIEAFHHAQPLSEHEARAVWPLMVLRASILVASGWRQLEIDDDNEYARKRVAGEQAIFDAATRYSLVEMTEQVLARLEFEAEPSVILRERSEPQEPPLRRLLPEFSGDVAVLDPGVESETLEAGIWLATDAEQRLVAEAFAGGAAAAIFPYGVYRLTRTAVNAASACETWPTATEIWIAPGEQMAVVTPEVASPWRVVIDGLHDGVLAASHEPRCLRVTVVRDNAPAHSNFVAPERVSAWRRFTRDPAKMLGLEPREQFDEASAELARRERIFASAQERYYERPTQIERGWRHHLVDTTGRAYVDMVNNVTGLGHGHTGVADAVNRQIRLLNTNSRFLYRDLAEYSERLLAMLPDQSDVAEERRLDTVLLVNSGSEAVDLALRLAQAATGRQTIIALREAYHGWTMASDAVTTSAYDNPHAIESRPEWVHVADVPNWYRGTHRGSATDPTLGARYAAAVGTDITRLEQQGTPVAGFICESVLGNAGGVLLPEGYLSDVYARVRAAGGLCIADEVQVGFGRMGSTFWGFEQSRVMPDIITIAKPMGNGFPIGGVITSKRVADALATQGQFFASTGGNPLSCQVGLAVLDAMEQEQLQENARQVGNRLAAGFAELALRHDLVGPTHGTGLYLGVELVRDRDTLEPAAAEAAAICERVRELGVVMLTTSERSNVLKIKPPLCLTPESVDFVVDALDRVLTEGW